MAFTGAATTKIISDCKARITGLTLAGAAAGTISLSNGAGEVKLPAACKWHAYENAQKVNVLPLGDLLYVSGLMAADANGVVGKVQQTKAGAADDGSDFLLTLTNSDAMNATPAMEINLAYHV